MTTHTLIRITLDIQQRWAVGGVAEVTDAVDLPILMDPREGKPFVPGTGLAGSLRRHLVDVGMDADNWLGPVTGEREERGVHLQPSRLRIVGSTVRSSQPQSVQERGRTKIDNFRGAAGRGSLRTEQAAHPSQCVVVLEHAGGPSSGLRDALSSWTPFIGRGRTNGMGAAYVQTVDEIGVDLGTAAGLHWWLTDRHTWLFDGEAPPSWGVRTTTATTPADLPEVLALRWKSLEPFRIGTEAPEARDNPLVRGTSRVAPLARDADGAAIVPATSWRGVFRHRVRAILGCLGAPETTRSSVAQALFGSMSRGRGLLTFHDSVVTGHMGQRTHVAIDRFTGGALPGALFTETVVEPDADLELRVTSHHQLPDPVRHILLHVVADLHDGLIGIGSGSWRGNGTLRLVNPEHVSGLAAVDVDRLNAWATAAIDDTGHDDDPAEPDLRETVEKGRVLL